MTEQISVVQGDFTCTRLLADQQIISDSPVYITAPVGPAAPPRCRNYPEDVKTIQKALNRFSPLEGGPPTPLTINGALDPQTRTAIYHFQEKWGLRPKGWKVPDGIVDPVGPTIERLRKGSGGVPNPPVEFLDRIPRVMQIISAARLALMSAKTYYSYDSPFSELTAKKVDRHFHQSKLSDPARRIDEVDAVFLGMQTAIGYVPQGIILTADEPATMASGAYMFAFMGGYSRHGKDDTWNGLPRGSIYLCPKSRTLTQESFAYVMIHELAHYVGPIPKAFVIDGIEDHAYFHKGSQSYKNLAPEKAFKNADCYAQFAFDAVGKPDYDATQNRS